MLRSYRPQRFKKGLYPREDLPAALPGVVGLQQEHRALYRLFEPGVFVRIIVAELDSVVDHPVYAEMCIRDRSYMNQKAVGEAIRESGVAREEIFLTTKIWMQDNSYEKCRKAVDLALSELDTDYIDLLLLHQPMGDYYGAWRALEEEMCIRDRYHICCGAGA